MKIKNLKSLLQNKQKIISREQGYPSQKSGRDGDFQVRKISGQGIFLFYKWNNKWYSSRLTQYRPRTAEHKQKVKIPIGVSPSTIGELSLDSTGNLAVKKGNDKLNHIISVDKDNLADTSRIDFTRAFSGTASMDGNMMLKNTTKSAVAHSWLTLYTTKGALTDAADSYINYVYEFVSEGQKYSGWCVGMDGSASKAFKWLTHPNSSDVVTVPSTENIGASATRSMMELSTSGDLSIKGDFKTYGIDTDATGSTSFFASIDGYQLKKVSAANTLASIGAQATVTAGTNCTFSGATLNVDDAFIKNDANDTMAGTLAITSTTADQFKVLYDASNYALLNVSATGDLEIETIGAGTTDSDITLNADGDIELNADGGDITFKDASATLATIQESGITFQDQAGVNLNADDQDRIYGDGNNIIISKDDTDVWAFNDADVFSEVPLKIRESADAVADTAGYGQLWVDTATPNELAFTDDAGTDIVGIGKYHYDIRVTNFYGAAAANYLPLAGYIIERTSTTSSNEYIGLLAPFTGTLEQVTWRSEIAQSGATSLRILEASDGTELPGTAIYRKDYTLGATADDTTITVDMTSPSVGTDPPVLTKGKLYVVYLVSPAIPYDTNVTLVFKWDITS